MVLLNGRSDPRYMLEQGGILLRLVSHGAVTDAVLAPN